MSVEIIDLHPHVIARDTQRYPPSPQAGQQSAWSATRPQSFEQLIEQMDAAGVAKAAIVQAASYYGFNNSYVADCLAQEPDRFTGVCSIDVSAPDAIAVLQDLQAKGFTGLRVFTGGATHGSDDALLADPRIWPVWDYCAQVDVPICVQTAPSGLGHVRALLERFQGTRIILDHIARPVLKDGPPYKAAQSLFDLAAYDHLYLKLTPRSFDLARTGQSTPTAFFTALLAAFGAKRIAFGSNLPANEGPMEVLVAQALEGLSGLAEADRAMILSGTARHLYPALA